MRFFFHRIGFLFLLTELIITDDDQLKSKEAQKVIVEAAIVTTTYCYNNSYNTVDCFQRQARTVIHR